MVEGGKSRTVGHQGHGGWDIKDGGEWDIKDGRGWDIKDGGCWDDLLVEEEELQGRPGPGVRAQQLWSGTCGSVGQSALCTNLFHICQKQEIFEAQPLTLDLSLYKARIQKVGRLKQV